MKTNKLTVLFSLFAFFGYSLEAMQLPGASRQQVEQEDVCTVCHVQGTGQRPLYRAMCHGVRPDMHRTCLQVWLAHLLSEEQLFTCPTCRSFNPQLEGVSAQELAASVRTLAYRGGRPRADEDEIGVSVQDLFDEQTFIAIQEQRGRFVLKMLSHHLDSLVGLNANNFPQLAQLHELWLSQNNFSRLTRNSFAGMPDLDVLYLSDNPLDAVAVDSFALVPNLTKLALSNNHLETLPQGILDPLTQLQRISITDCKRLATLPEGLLDNKPALQQVFLQNNALENLPVGFFSQLNAGVQRVNLSGNSFDLLEMDRIEREIRAVAPHARIDFAERA